MAVVVKALVVEAILKRVSGVTGSPSPIDLTPYPLSSSFPGTVQPDWVGAV